MLVHNSALLLYNPHCLNLCETFRAIETLNALALFLAFLLLGCAALCSLQMTRILGSAGYKLILASVYDGRIIVHSTLVLFMWFELLRDAACVL